MDKDLNSIVDRYSKIIVENSAEFLFAYTRGEINPRKEDIPVFVTEIKKYLTQMVEEITT